MLCGLIVGGHSQEKKYTVLFEYNQSAIPDTALIAIMKLISKKDIAHIKIEGHCDSIGSKEYNYSLSSRRANEVKKLLTSNGISINNINTVVGYGEDKPLTSNESEKERQLNRRVIIHFFTNEKNEQPKSTNTSTLNQQEFVVGKKIVLNNLFFYAARHKIKPESRPTLENLCSILTKNAGLVIEIQGHVCCTTYEPDGYDIETRSDNLSVNRAEAVYNFLVQECGIDAKRLSFRGFGGTQKITQQEDTEEHMQLNRRVEIKILSQ